MDTPALRRGKGKPMDCLFVDDRSRVLKAMVERNRENEEIIDTSEAAKYLAWEIGRASCRERV